MEDSFSSVIKLILFLIIIAGGIISDIVKKNKARKRAEAEIDGDEDDIEEEDEPYAVPPVAVPLPMPRQSGNTAARAQSAASKPAVSKISRNDDSEWLLTLADRKRKDAAKTAAKAAAAFEAEELRKSSQSQQHTPFTLTAEQAKEGFVLAEILGPPVSMR